ncbi:MAG: hypothetical protein DCC71_08030 [Proteobacteria bacterium]|nr:MAG: hypothetical protein DCC71_08030 [Pseudomonadota bacterium]
MATPRIGIAPPSAPAPLRKKLPGPFAAVIWRPAIGNADGDETTTLKPVCVNTPAPSAARVSRADPAGESNAATPAPLTWTAGRPATSIDSVPANGSWAAEDAVAKASVAIASTSAAEVAERRGIGVSLGGAILRPTATPCTGEVAARAAA